MVHIPLAYIVTKDRVNKALEKKIVHVYCLCNVNGNWIF